MDRQLDDSSASRGDSIDRSSRRSVIAALRALHGGDVDRARSLIDTAGADALAGALRAHLDRPAAGNVYDEPWAFEEFISTGDNPALYAATIAAVHQLHRDVAPERLLDIGCGDGRVTTAALTTATSHVDLLEPSEQLLQAATRHLAGHGVSVNGLPLTMQQLVASDGSGTRRWDLAQSTFAFHSLEPAARRGAITWLAERAPTFAIVEFDVPEHDPGSDEHLAHLTERYEAGLSVYADHPSVVGGFLMPVLVGQIEPGRLRHTWEQSIDSWCEDLGAAGFEPEAQPLFEHWWATAYLVVGRR